MGVGGEEEERLMGGRWWWRKGRWKGDGGNGEGEM